MRRVLLSPLFVDGHIVKRWVDDESGVVESFVVPCGSPRCKKIKCRRALANEIICAFETVKSEFNHSCLITVNNLPEFDVPNIRALVHSCLIKSGVRVKTVSVVESHKRDGYVHVHCLVLSDKKISAYYRDLISLSLDPVLNTKSDVHFSNRKRANSSVAYLLKNFLARPVQHLALNNERVLSVSRGFWVTRAVAGVKNRRRRLNARVEWGRRRFKRMVAERVSSSSTTTTNSINISSTVKTISFSGFPVKSVHLVRRL